MYGWRMRIGLLVPATNGVAEQEYRRLADHVDGVAVFAARVPCPPGRISKQWERDYGDGCLGAAERILSVEPDVIVIANTSGTLMNADRKLAEQVHKATGVKTIATIQAVVDSLKRLHVRRLGLVTPYNDEFNQEFLRYFAAARFKVVDLQTQNESDILSIGRLRPEVAYSLARRLSGKFDGIFISGTDFRSIEAIPLLERDMHVPVISSNLASFSEALLAGGIRASLQGWGRLLERPWESD